MNRGERRRKTLVVEDAAAVLGDAERFAEEGLGGGSAEADDHFRLNFFQFGVEPGAAGGDFAGAGLFMEAAFAARFPFEVLDGIRDVDFVAVDAGFDEAVVEQQAGGTDKGLAFAVFAVAGLFADEDEAGRCIAGSKDGLRGIFKERTTLAGAGGLTEAFQIAAAGQEGSGRGGDLGKTEHASVLLDAFRDQKESGAGKVRRIRAASTKWAASHWKEEREN